MKLQFLNIFLVIATEARYYIISLAGSYYSLKCFLKF